MKRQQILQNLKGVFPPLVTPFNKNGKIDESRFKENLRRFTNIGLSGFLIAGSTGEGPLLSARERLRLIEIARRIVRPPEIILAGTGLESTPATLELSREAVERGADAHTCVLQIQNGHAGSGPSFLLARRQAQASRDDLQHPAIHGHQDAA